MGFTTELVAQQVGDFDWRLVEPLKYEGNRDLFEVPKDATTDFASVPAPFQWLIPRSGRYTKAAVLHDYLWRHGKQLNVSRSDADGLFRRAMADLDVPFLRRWVMWGAVRVASLVKSVFRDGARDIPQLLLVFVFPGILVVAGGLFVVAMQFAFYILELVAAAFLWVLRKLGVVQRHIKPVKRPTVSWLS
jgi:hypothetical protein